MLIFVVKPKDNSEKNNYYLQRGFLLLVILIAKLGFSAWGLSLGCWGFWLGCFFLGGFCFVLLNHSALECGVYTFREN